MAKRIKNIAPEVLNAPDLTPEELGEDVMLDIRNLTVHYEVDGDVVDLSVSGRYVAVLFSDHMTIYDKTLRELATLDEVSTVRQVLMRDDGSAVLAGLTSASLYLP